MTSDGNEAIALAQQTRPDVAVIDLMMPQKDGIAATAEKMNTARIVVWAQHGIYGAGRDLDEAFGLIETVEKAAEVYLKIAHLPILNTIKDDELRTTADFFGVKVHEGWL